MESRKRGLVKVGDTALAKDLAADLIITPAEYKLIDAATEIRMDPDAVERAFLARELVQCTLPHRDPGNVEIWVRTNGNVTLALARTGLDPKTGTMVGFPFGSLPRLLLFWINTEAKRTGKRRLILGDTFSSFIRDLGLNPRTGGSAGGDYRRIREQMVRLFSAVITFHYRPDSGAFERDSFMNIRDKSELWWNPKRPDQIGLFDSWVELGQRFFETITTHPVFVDKRHLRALKRSPLALDLYIWAVHKAYTARTTNRGQFVPWIGLSRQFGGDYDRTRNFKQKAIVALRKIKAVYPGLELRDEPGGLLILSESRPPVPMR